MKSDSRRTLMQQAYALVLAGGRGSRLCQLTDHRAKPAVPFAGTMRIIDFALSNCVNSGLRRIGVLTQYKAQSLIRHVDRSWGFLEASLGEYVDIVPAQQQHDERWYTGTAAAVYQNLDILRESRPRHVVVLGGDHVYKMDYGVMLTEHVQCGADMSVACLQVPLEQASQLGVMSVDADDRILAFDEKPARPTPLPGRPGHALASMGIYVFDADFLMRELERDAADAQSSHDFGKDLIPWLVGRAHVQAHRFETSCVNLVGERPYWRDVGTLDAYWEANLDLTRGAKQTVRPGRPCSAPASHRQPGSCSATLPAHGDRLAGVGGCIVRHALLRRSILFTGARAAEQRDRGRGAAAAGADRPQCAAAPLHRRQTLRAA
jgi:glucose-1-phosphate adenylyltransferase